jgi:hypothetical protein
MSRSWFPVVGHIAFELLPGDSKILDENDRLFRFGIIIARPVIVGDESGEDASARVEW